jgi:hypothetical protein
MRRGNNVINKVLHVMGVILALMSFSTTSGTAQTLSDCDDWRSSAFFIAEPWEANTKLYAADTVRLAIMDVGEPVVGSYRLLILSTTLQEPIERICKVMSFDDDLGFAGLSLDGATDTTDPKTGPMIKIPAKRWLAATDTYVDAVLTVMLDAATGDILGKLD